jgi:hypothetical protein
MILESESVGVRGKLDALRRRDGRLIPHEQKKGRARKGAFVLASQAHKFRRVPLAGTLASVRGHFFGAAPEVKLFTNDP